LSTEPHPIKVAATAPSDNMKADEIAIKTAKTGEVTAVVAVMSMFCEKDAICKTLSPGMRSFLANRQKVPISQRNISANQETFLRKQEKSSYQRN
jgi:hypothetical protein